jgi:hypothetical protein
MFAAKWHQLFELREEQKQQRQLERQQMAQQIVGNGGGGGSSTQQRQQRPSVAQLQTLLDQGDFEGRVLGIISRIKICILEFDIYGEFSKWIIKQFFAAIFKHIFLDHRGGSDGVFAATSSSTSQPLTAAAAAADDFIGQRRKRMRIADKCCAQDGCDDTFLNSFCRRTFFWSVILIIIL